MPTGRLDERQKRIIRAFSNALRDNPDKTDWSYNTMPSDDNAFDLSVDINAGIPAVDEIRDIHKSDLKLFGRMGIITPIPGRKAFRVNKQKVHRLASR